MYILKFAHFGYRPDYGTQYEICVPNTETLEIIISSLENDPQIKSWTIVGHDSKSIGLISHNEKGIFYKEEIVYTC